MLFYKIEATQALSAVDGDGKSQRPSKELCTALWEKSQSQFNGSDRRRMVFTVAIRDCYLTFGAIIKDTESVDTVFSEYQSLLPFKLQGYRLEEITLESATELLKKAQRSLFVSDSAEVLESFGLEAMSNAVNTDFEEELLPCNMTADKAVAISRKALYTSTLTPELKRIYKASPRTKPKGHPVHYILQAETEEARKAVSEALLASLYSVGRIKNRRYCLVSYDTESILVNDVFEDVCKSCENGAVVICYDNVNKGEDTAGRSDSEIIAYLCAIAKKYKHKVLTLICLPENSDTLKRIFTRHFDTTCFVELKADVVCGAQATAYLRGKARDVQIRTDDRLFSALDDKGYTAAQLDRLFDKWYNNKLCTDVYPQYKTVATPDSASVKAQSSASSREKLESLVGLSAAKKVIREVINLRKAQRLFASRGLPTDRPSMNMVFTGNPGTAKTTVARLFAQILKEEGILPKGHLCEVGRADIVGQYLGATAIRVKRAFEKAKGGVLFIDEAYSLVDHKSGMYGDEAINTIVQEMENNRDDTVVIFAGYPDKMESFFRTNPGLRSRISHHIPFEDYTASELCDIAVLLASQKGLTLFEKALQRLETAFSAAVTAKDFGNGRFVRNTIEKAITAQANRLVEMDATLLTDNDITTILAEDIAIPATVHKEKTFKIGFTA